MEFIRGRARTDEMVLMDTPRHRTVPNRRPANLFSISMPFHNQNIALSEAGFVEFIIGNPDFLDFSEVQSVTEHVCDSKVGHFPAKGAPPA